MFESKINRGRANGYAPLDGSGKVPLDKLPPIQSTINTGSFATTGSNTFTGTQTISSSGDSSLTIGEVNTPAGPSFGLRVSGSDGAPLFITADAISLIGAVANPTNPNDDASFFANQLISFPVSDGPTAGIVVQKSGSFQSNWIFDYDGKGYFPSDITIGYNSLNGLTSGSLNITNGDINLTGSLLMTGSITLNGVTYTSLTGNGGTAGESGTSGVDGTSGTDGVSGTSGVDGTSGESGTSGVDGTSGTSILLDSILTFEGNTISGSIVETVGTKITIAQDYYGGTGLNGNGLMVADNAETSGIQSGWIVTFYNGTTRTVLGNSMPGGQLFRSILLDSSVNLNPAYPVTVESPDYQLGSDAFVELKVSSNTLKVENNKISLSSNTIVTGSVLANSITGSLLATNGVISSSQQITNFGFVSSSTTLPNGVISSSQQITNFGFVSASTADTTLLNQFTGSINTYTGSNDNVISRVLQTTASLNTFRGSINNIVSNVMTYTASLKTSAIVSSSTQVSNYGIFATLNANNFNGNQVITGSLTVSSTAISEASLFASASNLVLNSGSNLYINNNGLVSITDKLQVSGSLIVSTSTNLTGSVTINESRIDNGWTAYIPQWTAASSNPVINNGTIEGYYKVVGKTCFVRGNIAIGSTTTFGSGEWYVSMPFTASHADAILMTVTLLDNGTAWYNASMVGARAGFNHKAPMQYQNTGGTASDVNATQPFTWTTSDRFIWNGSYEIA
jgi:hypothetical protein